MVLLLLLSFIFISSYAYTWSNASYAYTRSNVRHIERSLWKVAFDKINSARNISNHLGWHAAAASVGRHWFKQHRFCCDNRSLANDNVPKDGGPNTHGHTILELGVAVAADLARAPEGDPLAHRAVPPQHRRLAYHNVGSLAKVDPSPNGGCWVNVSMENLGVAALEEEGQVAAAAAVQVVRHTVHEGRVQALAEEEGGEQVGHGGVAQRGGQDVRADHAPQPRLVREHLQDELPDLHGGEESGGQPGGDVVAERVREGLVAQHALVQHGGCFRVRPCNKRCLKAYQVP
mmetsp:Transcript_4854/g.8628  ORF Transcript_4854/g.8628 Transcript_4854/m.8628 type:complete len:289 (+) Transcript_4854:200-1066(+)|eukprot:CAMPEP_0206371606 /NCGR_PEP_ID=MMETSP0294-20121207/6582_1 /ASSEMBLY_ACC=CAM_ASM_000327 /TAXON_ID=39354 /ORGANISM="Heterosigma akashiwo, Strain CCMP2393" /LENGTH=288 /DNA_ID=CAMNT_0053818763 /DNA_START=62 /DNA_END=928 /DNA_ORIENTATION=-